MLPGTSPSGARCAASSGLGNLATGLLTAAAPRPAAVPGARAGAAADFESVAARLTSLTCRVVLRSGAARLLATGARACPSVGGGSAAAWRRVGREQLRVQPLQLGTGIHAELIGDHLPRLAVRLERLGPPPARLKRPHQQRPEPLPQRMLDDEPAQLGYHLGRPAARRSASTRSSVVASRSSAARSACVSSSGSAGHRRAAARATARAPRRAARRPAPRPRSSASALLPSAASDSKTADVQVSGATRSM